MRDRPGGRTAATFRTVTIALLVVGVVAAAGYGLQRALLRSPPQGELVAADIEGMLLQHRYITSVVHIPGVPTRRAECLEGWQPGRNGRPAGRGARIIFSDGERLILGARHIARITPPSHPTRLRPIVEVQLAGCGRSLTNFIYNRLLGSRRSKAEPGRFRGRPALFIHVRTRRDRFDLYVDPETLSPLGIKVETERLTAWSTLEPVRLTPELKQDFERRFDG